MDRRILTLCGLVLLGVFVWVGSTLAAPQRHPKPDPDRVFAAKAAEGSLAEVKLGELAEQKGDNEAVKAFGKQMVEDHTKANEELRSLAATKSITLPTEVSAADRATYERLSKLSGPAFDRAYIAGMVKGHKAVAAEFRKESTRGKDAEIKAWAEKTLPTVEHHLMMATEDQKHLMVRHTSH